MTRTFGQIERLGDAFVLRALEPHVAIKIKALFPGLPKAASVLSFPASPTACADLAWFMERYPLAGPPDVLDAVAGGRTAFGAQQAQAERLMMPDYVPPLYAGLKGGQAVRPHQGRAAELVKLYGGLLVGDETGKGKTYTACATMLAGEGMLPALVVCPPNLKRQWKRKIEEFTTLRAVTVDTTTPYALPPADVWIIGYTQLSGWADVFELMGLGLVVFDEAHELRRGADAAKGQAAIRLAAMVRYRLGMTATPIFNYGGEIFEVMQVLRPEVLGDRDAFLREWCEWRGAGQWSVKAPAALGAYLREQKALVRETKDSPKPNVVVHELRDFDAAALDRVETLARSLAVTATTGSFTERGEATRELDMLVRQATGLGKALAVSAFTRIIVEGGAPVILFGWHRGVYDLWLQDLADLKPAMHTGSETPARKAQEVGRFLSGETDVLIVSLRSGAGLDGLQHRCSTVIFGELDWSPAMHEQCIGRVDREGQAMWEAGEGVNVVYLTAPDGSDPPIMEVLGLKASESSRIVDPSLGVQARQTDHDKFRKLIERYVSRPVAGEVV